MSDADGHSPHTVDESSLPGNHDPASPHRSRRRRVACYLGFDFPDPGAGAAEYRALKKAHKKARKEASRENGHFDVRAAPQSGAQPHVATQLELSRARWLTRRRDELANRRSMIGGVTNTLFISVLALLVASGPVALLASPSAAGIVCGYAALLLVAAVICRQRYWEVTDELRQVENDFDRLKLAVQEEQRRALKLFQNHALELRRYYGQALKHAAVIFWVGVGCILLGFAVVALTLLVLDRLDPGADTTVKIVVGTLGAVSALMANFIGAIYLRMYSQTVSSLGGFHTRLVTTHHLHFANFLAAKIDSERRQDETFAQMAVALAGSAVAGESGPLPDGQPADPAAGRVPAIVTPGTASSAASLRDLPR